MDKNGKNSNFIDKGSYVDSQGGYGYSKISAQHANTQNSEEVIELEFDEDSVEYYIVDENNNEIGVCLNENGKKIEYLYQDLETDEKAKEIKKNIDKLKSQADVAKQSLKSVNDELYSVKDEALDIYSELKGTYNDLNNIVDGLKDDLKLFKWKKKK